MADIKNAAEKMNTIQPSKIMTVGDLLEADRQSRLYTEGKKRLVDGKDSQ